MAESKPFKSTEHGVQVLSICTAVLDAKYTAVKAATAKQQHSYQQTPSARSEWPRNGKVGLLARFLFDYLLHLLSSGFLLAFPRRLPLLAV